MKKMAYLLISLLLLLSACDERKTSLSSQELYGTVRIDFNDSFHLGDSTSNLFAGVEYNVATSNGLFSHGIYEIPQESQVGDIHQLILNRVAAGSLLVDYSVSRPFILLGRKDDISRARFSDSTSVFLLPNGAEELGPVDIWAFRLNRLIIHFDPDISAAAADSIAANLGVLILNRKSSFFDGGLIYFVDTRNVGPEVEVKRIAENFRGVNSVVFDVIGHTYF
jgi:hypothetical protein